MTTSQSGAPHVDLDHLVHHTELPRTRLSAAIDPWIRRSGEIFSWVWVVLVAVITVNVVMRYALGKGLVQFEEAQWHLYAIGFLLGLAYCLESDDHVRIDVLSERWRPTTVAWVELYGIVLLLIPFLLLVLWYAVPFIAYSFRIGEVSEAPGGLPLRWAIKSVLFISFALLALATTSRLSRVIAFLFGAREVAAKTMTQPHTEAHHAH
ncbi:MAG TPA: TRAP transporter small permease subunit [Burkholderiaceae bacterium]|nr:TRAP transporter small permease subunit [Burkholderiaceae bacterium]